MDVETVEKYLIFMALDLWALGITGFENEEINRMMDVETARKEVFKREQNQDFENFLFQKISLVVLAQIMLGILDE